MDNNYTENASFGLSTDEIAQIRYQFDAFIREMYACLPCKVLAVNGGGLAPVGTVNIQPLIQQRTATGEMVPYPVIYNAPYFRLQGGTNAIIIDPEPGDIGFAVFSSRDISGVKRTRGDSATASLRKFSLSDAIYVNGILNSTPKQYIQFSQAGITVYSPTAINLTAPTVTITADQQVTAGGKPNPAEWRCTDSDDYGRSASDGRYATHDDHRTDDTDRRERLRRTNIRRHYEHRRHDFQQWDHS